MMAKQHLRLKRSVTLGFGIVVIALGVSSCGGNNRSIVPNNPVPIVLSVSPATATVGQAFVLSVNGSGFVAQSTILWNGAARPTTFVSSNQLKASILATDVASSGVVQVQVSNPSPGGGMSSIVSLNVDNPQPSLISFSPFSAKSGGGSFQLAVYGSNFVPNAVVLWNGNARTTAFVSGSQLTAEISASDITIPGTAQITVLNPSPGGGASRIFRFGIDAGVAIQRFLYVANSNSNTISGYHIDPNSGSLTELPGSPFIAAPTATSPGPMIGDRLGKFLYVLNRGTIGCKGCSSLSIFSQDGQGNLVPLAGSPFPSIGFAVADPTGNIVYQSSGNDIVTMLIDASSGALIQLADSPGFAQFVSMTMHPAGTFLYGASGNGVWVGSSSVTSGAVTPVPGSPFGGMSVGFFQPPVGASVIAVDPSGKFAFAVHNNFLGDGSSDLLSFTIDAATGALTLLNSTHYGPVNLSGVFVHPSGGFLYATGQGNNTIQAFTIDASGTLTPLAGSPFSTSTGSLGVNPIDMAMDPEGKFLYVSNYTGGSSGSISAFTVNTNSGALTPIAGSPFPAGAGPMSPVISSH
jgi:6-phosphogluconolactonase (cycloisomerase 2 family)